MVPKDMQKKIWQEYKGTTRAERFSKNSYLEACALAVEYVARLEDKPTKNGYRLLIESNIRREAYWQEKRASKNNETT